MTDPEARYELQADAPLVPNLVRPDEPTARRADVTRPRPLLTNAGNLGRPGRRLGGLGGR